MSELKKIRFWLLLLVISMVAGFTLLLMVWRPSAWVIFIIVAALVVIVGLLLRFLKRLEEY